MKNRFPSRRWHPRSRESLMLPQGILNIQRHKNRAHLRRTSFLGGPWPKADSVVFKSPPADLTEGLGKRFPKFMFCSSIHKETFCFSLEVVSSLEWKLPLLLSQRWLRYKAKTSLRILLRDGASTWSSDGFSCKSHALHTDWGAA